MTSVFDVAAYILRKKGPMTAMKLQKLVYYSQAWSLVWDDEPLFGERIEAWANGPVVPELYLAHRGRFKLAKDDPCIAERSTRQALSRTQRETVDAVLEYYGGKPSHWLSEVTHVEDPWKDAREGLRPGERGNAEITPAAMAEYYGSL